MYKMIDTSQALNSAAVSTVLEWGQKHTHTHFGIIHPVNVFGEMESMC